MLARLMKVRRLEISKRLVLTVDVAGYGPIKAVQDGEQWVFKGRPHYSDEELAFIDRAFFTAWFELTDCVPYLSKCDHCGDTLQDDICLPCNRKPSGESQRKPRREVSC